MLLRYSVFAALLILNLGLTACQPQTTAEKVENKAEDVAHETGQAMERAGEKVKDATN